MAWPCAVSGSVDEKQQVSRTSPRENSVRVFCAVTYGDRCAVLPLLIRGDICTDTPPPLLAICERGDMRPGRGSGIRRMSASRYGR